jgi:hypothetical protein
MDLDLRNTTEGVRQKFLLFTKKCLEKQNSELGFVSEPEKMEINLDDAAILDAEKQAQMYAVRRNNGYRSLENAADKDIRKGIQEWMRRTNRFRNL